MQFDCTERWSGLQLYLPFTRWHTHSFPLHRFLASVSLGFIHVWMINDSVVYLEGVWCMPPPPPPPTVPDLTSFFPGPEGADLLHRQVQVHLGHRQQPQAQHRLRLPGAGLQRGRLRHLRAPRGDHHQGGGRRWEVTSSPAPLASGC